MTPPADRLPVTTIVANYDKELIKQAITRELERKGQTFFLYNRVESIGKIRDYLEELVPQARFAVAHGQMSPGALEDIMTRFVRKEYDVLICTTIIESGIDIPNVNTIIIDRADRFGLSELYQLRGRVGRYHRQAYAYLLLPPMGSLPANARQRLDAIRKYTHLGAGFKLAMKDLEIRGAGNILGEEQSGHIAAVGFELYCQLLKEAIARLENQEVPKIIEVPVDFDTITGSINPVPGMSRASIPPDYISDELARIDCYKRLHAMTSPEEIESFRQELSDRFGPLPEPVLLLLQLGKIRAFASKLNLVRLTVRNRRLLLETQKGLYKPDGRNLPTLFSSRGPEQVTEILDILQKFPKRNQ
jgi:transcription-repair coupling factor (superfamily II helicase)